SGDVAEPLGRIVLRGMSASTRLQPPELVQFSLGAVRDTTPAGSRTPATGHEHTAHAGAAAPGDTSVRWTSVPMPAGLAMLPAEMALRPATTPYLPRARSTPPAARSREIVRLTNGDTLRLTAGLVMRTFKGQTLTMFGF